MRRSPLLIAANQLRAVAGLDKVRGEAGRAKVGRARAKDEAAASVEDNKFP